MLTGCSAGLINLPQGEFRGIIVPEASARYDVDGIFTADADHFDVCRPSSSKSSTFKILSNFITSRIEEVISLYSDLQ